MPLTNEIKKKLLLLMNTIILVMNINFGTGFDSAVSQFPHLHNGALLPPPPISPSINFHTIYNFYSSQ